MASVRGTPPVPVLLISTPASLDEHVPATLDIVATEKFVNRNRALLPTVAVTSTPIAPRITMSFLVLVMQTTFMLDQDSMVTVRTPHVRWNLKIVEIIQLV